MAIAPEVEAVDYRVHHSSAYRYGHEIMLAHHLLHLSPRLAPGQSLRSFRLDIEPEPAVMTEHQDYFGNRITYFEVHEPHSWLTIRAETEVLVDENRPGPDDRTTPWEQLRDCLASPVSDGERHASIFAYASPKVAIMPELRDYALPSFAAGRTIGAAAMDLSNRIHADFVVDSSATTISTPVAEVLAIRRGVCQDFAHLAVGCLRSLGLAARYVSGYLRTIPPPGRPRAIGADVSHAWLSVWCGGDDWLDLDPTNGKAGSSDLITLAWGRDYGDVSPSQGVILGSSIQYLTVSVDVEAREG